MSNATSETSADARKAAPSSTEKPLGVLHRVCVQCNNVFRVPADKFDAKQCPNCHKG